MSGEGNDIGIGVGIDPVTQRPRVYEEEEETRREKQEKALKKQAEDLALTNSEAGQRLIAIIRRKLQERIERVLKDDPQSAALVELLIELGVRSHHAEKALEMLADLYVRKGGDMTEG